MVENKTFNKCEKSTKFSDTFEFDWEYRSKQWNSKTKKTFQMQKKQKKTIYSAVPTIRIVFNYPPIHYLNK
jgi:hypothetical protein